MGLSFFSYNGTFATGLDPGPLPTARLFNDAGRLRLISETGAGQASWTLGGGLPTLASNGGIGGLAAAIGFAGDQLRFAAADLNGVLGRPSGQSISVMEGSSGRYADSYQMLSFENGGKTFLVVGDQTGTGLATYVQNAQGRFNQIDFVDTLQDTPLAQITGMAHAQVGGDQFVVAVSAQENAVAVLGVDAQGQLIPRTILGAAQYLPIADPQDVDIVIVGGSHFVVVASADSNSLTVFELEGGGVLTPIDQVIDTLDTRFQGADQIETFEHDGRAFILTGGQDSGISLFTLLPNGRIIHLETLVDTDDMPLAKITDMEVITKGDDVRLYIVGGSEAGMAQITLNLGDTGHVRVVSGNGHRATHDVDYLVASAGGDKLEGRNDNDILMDGTGGDTLYGGWGADLFVLSADGESDTIMDFQPGADSLDFSDWGFYRSPDQLNVTRTDTGAVIEFGDERLVVHSMRNDPLNAADFTFATTNNASHVDLSWVGASQDQQDNETIAADEIFKPQDPSHERVEAELFWGDAPPDHVQVASKTGTARADVLNGSSALDSVMGNGGGDVISGAEGADSLWGNNGKDTLQGGQGSDFISGGSGDDWLFGGSGHDTLLAGHGGDTLQGGSGRDVFMFDTSTNDIDTVEDFRDGSDILALRGVDGRFDALDIRTVTVGGTDFTEIAYDGHIIRLADTDAGDLDTTDFWFL